MSVVRPLTLDIGGSEARSWYSLAGGEITKCPNDFVQIPEQNFRYKELEDKLGVCRIVTAPREEYLGYLGVGITGKQYDGGVLTLTDGKSKTDSLHFFLQKIYMIARDAMTAKCSTVTNEMITQVLAVEDEVEFEYVIGTTIPIKEHSGSIDGVSKLRSKLAGTYKVLFPLLSETASVTFNIKPNCIGVLPEGGVCISALRKEITPSTYSLVVDVGHKTTDIALFKGLDLYGKPASPEWAGNTLTSNVKLALVDRGYNLTNEQVADALASGVVKQGAKTVDMLDLFIEEKERFVRNYIKDEILQVLSANKISANQIQNFIPIGAPMNGEGKNSMASMIVRECGLQDAEVKILSDDLRYVNIRQTDLFTQILYNKVAGTKNK